MFSSFYNSEYYKNSQIDNATHEQKRKITQLESKVRELELAAELLARPDEAR
jgi:hypothetical protein